jgi:hypothetical protein
VQDFFRPDHSSTVWLREPILAATIGISGIFENHINFLSLCISTFALLCMANNSILPICITL